MSTNHGFQSILLIVLVTVSILFIGALSVSYVQWVFNTPQKNDVDKSEIAKVLPSYTTDQYSIQYSSDWQMQDGQDTDFPTKIFRHVQSTVPTFHERYLELAIGDQTVYSRSGALCITESCKCDGKKISITIEEKQYSPDVCTAYFDDNSFDYYVFQIDLSKPELDSKPLFITGSYHTEAELQKLQQLLATFHRK